MVEGRALTVATVDDPRSPDGQAAELVGSTTGRQSRVGGRRWARRLGSAAIALGILTLGYGAAVYFWHDPVTDLFTRWKQHQLQGQLSKEFATFQKTLLVRVPTTSGGSGAPATATGATTDELRTVVTRNAERFISDLHLGQALGRIKIPKLGLNVIFVHGTRWAEDLTRGPGHYTQTSLPGLDKVTAIAGHRTTFGAPFRHIDELSVGDTIELDMAYGTFIYRVFEHKVVSNNDWSIIRNRGFDTLVLSACHPLFSASHRWVVFARLVKVRTPDGSQYSLPFQ